MIGQTDIPDFKIFLFNIIMANAEEHSLIVGGCCAVPKLFNIYSSYLPYSTYQLLSLKRKYPNFFKYKK